jgi:hypothetical protein
MDGNVPPIWSYDNQYLASYEAGTLKKIDIAGGAAQKVCDLAVAVVGGFSSSLVVILPGPLMRVPAAGGTPVPVTSLSASRQGAYALLVCASAGPEALFL